MELVKSFEEACKVLNIDPAAVLPDVSAFPAPHQNALTAVAKLFIIADALNGDWKPDWSNYDQRKWWPWFDLQKNEESNPSGFRFDCVGYDYAYSTVGSRLCFKDRDTATYAGTQFIDLYRDFMTL